MSYCSSVDKYEDSSDSTKAYDLVCGEYKPRYRVCHISALNGEGSEPHYDFTPYSYFNKQLAQDTCAKIGGHLPRLQEELESIWIQKSMEDLMSFVSVGWPFSLKWLTYPVSNIIDVLIIYLSPHSMTSSTHVCVLLDFINFIVHLARRATLRQILAFLYLQPNIQVSSSLI